MFCAKCGAPQADGAEFCSACGNPVQSRVPNGAELRSKPVAGIVVGAVLGAAGLLWSSFALFGALTRQPEGLQGQMFSLFPALAGLNVLSASLGVLSQTVLVIGVGLTVALHSGGPKTVRATAWCMLAYTVLSTAVVMAALFGSASWSALAPPLKGALVGGVIGSALGTLGVWILLLYLFRRSRSW